MVRIQNIKYGITDVDVGGTVEDLAKKICTMITDKNLIDWQHLQFVAGGKILSSSDKLTDIDTSKPIIYRIKKPVEVAPQVHQVEPVIVEPVVVEEQDDSDFQAKLRSISKHPKVDREQQNLNLFTAAEDEFNASNIQVDHHKMVELMMKDEKFARQMMGVLMANVPEFRQDPELMIQMLSNPDMMQNVMLHKDNLVPPPQEDDAAIDQEIYDSLTPDDWTHIDQLVNMGFLEPDVVMAYVLCDGDPDATADFLFNHCQAINPQSE